MKYVIRGENIEVTNAIRDYIKEKLSKMDKYLDNPSKVDAKVIFSVNGVNQKLEVTINGDKYFIRTEVTHEDLYAAVDQSIDKLERQFRKYKTKLLNKNKREEIERGLEEYFEENEEQIVKRKKLFLKPMDEEEAITQMELLEHTFFVFKNSETNKVCILYKRKDEAYGILETN